MTRRSFKVAAHIGSGLPEFCRRLGIVIAPLAQSVGLKASEFNNVDCWVELRDLLALFHILELESQNDCIGLDYGEFCRNGYSGILGVTLLNAPSLRTALETYQEFQRLLCDHTFFAVELDRAEAHIEWQLDRSVLHQQHYFDLRALMITKLIRRFAGRGWFPRALLLGRNPPRSIDRHHHFFGADVSFAQTTNRLVFGRTELSSPNEGADPIMFRVMQNVCRQRLLHLNDQAEFRVAVRSKIEELLPSNRATLNAVCADMLVGHRTLQRRLVEIGTSFNELVEEVRLSISNRMLMSDVPISEIARSCGYAHVSAYSRAARKWYGDAPRRKREWQPASPETS